LGGAVGAKAAAGFATAAILTAGAVEVRNIGAGERDGGSPDPAPAAVVAPEPAFHPKLAAEVVPPLRVTTSEPVAPARPGERERVAPPAEPTEAEPGSAGAPAGPPTTEDATTTPDEGEVAVGTPVAPTGDGGDGQDTGAAPVDPPAPPTEPTEPTEPTVPTVPTGPVTPPTTPEPPTTPAPVAPATSGPPVVSGA
ncbi:MAG: hypothetical protein EDQ89_12965, partial [Acidobacteria bacterium]